MRAEPSILHLDLDAFFAAVEQRDKPSLRGKPVVVGGLGPRGVVATASYEARAYGVRSAMSIAEARSRCPHAAFLYPRFRAYQESSRAVMRLLGALSPVVEPLSLDEAFVDLAVSPDGTSRAVDAAVAGAVASRLRADVRATTGLTASIGAGTSKLIAKICSDLAKPDGLLVVAPGQERALLDPLPVSRLWGVGPATAERLRRLGAHTIGDLARVERDEVIGTLGQAHGTALWRLARADDDRPVVAEREAKSVSAEDTFDHDVVDLALLTTQVELQARRVVERLRRERHAGRTVTLKVRHPDFATVTRSLTLPGPTDDLRTIVRVARQLLDDVDRTGGLRLLGVGVSGLTDWTQEDLFSLTADQPDADQPDADQPAPVAPVGTGADGPAPTREQRGHERAPEREWRAGADVEHDELGRGWVWGAGLGRVTVRFESRATGPGRVRTFPADDPALAPAPPEPVAPVEPGQPV